ncbi:MAG: hypothetical protein CM1200mP20_13730 [Pseudomonadota bacterium]|nr:MAG: hypothetical protein CM1200mP20_13730 [Pseudomonadota bacterium]
MTGFDDLAAAHHVDPISCFFHHVQVMGKQQTPLARVFLNSVIVEDLGLGGNVHRRGRFVGNQ